MTAVTVSCTPQTLILSVTSQCSATVQGGSGNSAVTWSASAGTIASTGLFTAPLIPGMVTVKATSVVDGAVSGTAVLTVVLPIPLSKHVVLVMEGNQSYSTVAGDSTDWPQLNNLISKGSLPTNYYADSTSSIANSYMLATGQVLTADNSSTRVWKVDNIARRMLAAGVSFKVYAEGITQGYLGGDTGLYVIRHNPFAMFSDVADNPQVANKTIWPFKQFAADLANHALPRFSFIVPTTADDADIATPLQADA